MPDDTAAEVPRSWTLRCLGGPTIECGDGTAPLPLARKDAALLAYVGLEAVVPSAKLAALLWPSTHERGALNSLRQRLFRLRKGSGARLIELGAQACLAADLSCPAFGDMAALEADALAWDGDFLGAFDYGDGIELDAWVSSRRKAWHGERRDALAAIASSAEQQHEIVRALAYARRLLLDDPLSEYAHRRLMRLHYQRGDTASAVAAFEACEAALKDELGLQPSAETLALLQTIERGRLASAAATIGPGPVPATLLRPPRAVGRHAERAQLAQAHAEGQIAALVGEAGMGKTRLLIDFIAAQSKAVYAQARPGDAAVPYGVLARLLRALLAAAPAALAQAPRSELARVAPEWGDGAVALAGSTQASRLQAAIEQVMVEALAAGVATFVVDDLHFADPASVDMLRALVDVDALIGMRWVFAHRPIGAADDNGALLRALADSPRARWIALAPLTDADLVELLDSLALPGIGGAEFAPALARHTGGNPLYVLETLREARATLAHSAGLVLPRPQSIAHMIDRRLQRLSEGAVSLARVAALAGPDFSPDLAEHSLATPALLLASAWAELEAADVLRGSTFAHDLVQDGVLRATPKPIALHAHGRIAQYLQARGAEPARVAPHWLAAGDGPAAGAAYRDAATRAAQASRPREQVQLLQQAAAAFESCGDAAAALAARAEAVPPMIRSDGLSEALELSTQLVTQAGDGPTGGCLWTIHAETLCWASRASEAEVAGKNALARLPGSALAQRVSATRSLAMAQGMQGRAIEALDLLRPWLSRLDEIGTLGGRIELCAAYAMVLMLADRVGDAIDITTKQLSLAQQLGDKSEQLNALLSVTFLQMRRGDLDASIASSQQALALGHGDAQMRSTMVSNEIALGTVECGVGRYSDGLARIDAARRFSEAQSSGSNFQAMAEEVQAEAFWRLGQLARAQQAIAADHAGLATPSTMKRHILRALMSAAPTAERRKRLEEALAIKAGGRASYQALIGSIELAKLSEPGLAAEQLGRLYEESLAKEYFGIAAAAVAARLDAWCSDGRIDLVADQVFRAEDLVRRYRSPSFYWPELVLSCARGHGAIGDAVAATRCLGDALAWVRASALTNVPDEFRESFIERNPVNLALRAEAARYGVSSTTTGA